MDIELIVLVAGIPFYALGLIIVSYAGMYAMHAAKTLDDSAAEQAITELPTGSTAK